MLRLWSLPGCALLLALSLPGAPVGAAEAIELPKAEEIDDAIPEGESLTGREIYERFLKNKLHSAVQHQRVISTDPGGSEQMTQFWVRWKDYRDEDDEAVDGILGKTLVRFQRPFDMRHTSFLMILRDDRGHDQFVYRPSARKVKRVNLKSASVMGTDYSFDDIGYQSIRDADYHRLPDEEIGGERVYVVEAMLRPNAESQYRKTMAYLEKEHYVPLRARYWDKAGVEIKEMTAKYDSIKEFDGVWLATVSVMHNLKFNTKSTLIIEKLDANPDIAENLFSVFRLALRR